jgi:4-amino-4-deoxy-L-arabinose transferase-like glycosyltransferase
VPAAAALSCLVIIGFWLRIHHLGNLGLIVDEGHQALAVNGILQHGYPVLPTGRTYAWNLVFIYLQSAAALVFGVNEFSLRLPGALFGVATIPMTYWFGRTLFNAKAGLLAALLIALSVWEIEVSRYARAYTVYQFFYVLSLVAFYKGFIKGERRWQFLVPPLFVLTYMLTPLGATLLMAFLVPFFVDSTAARTKWTAVLCAGLTAGGCFLYGRGIRFLDSRFSPLAMEGTAGGDLPFLERLRHAIKANFHTPETGLLRELYARDHRLFLLLCGLLLLTVGVLFYLVYRDKSERVPGLFALPVIAACYLHQFALAAILFCLYLLISYRNRASLTSAPYLVVYASAALTFRFWSAYAKLHPLPSFSFARYFWDFPKLHDYLLQWLVQGWPRFSVVTAGGLLLLGHRFFQDRTRGTYLFPVALGLLLPLFASAIYWPYYVPRYFFHLYPLLVVVFAFTLCALGTAVQSRASRPGPDGPRPPGPARRVVEAVALVFLAAVLSQDIYPSQVLAIGNRSYTSPKDPIKASQSWELFQQDYQTPGRYVRAHLLPRDTVVVLGASHVASIFYHYIGRVDYVLMLPHEVDLSSPGSFVLGTGKGLVYYMTGSAVLQDAPALEHWLSTVRTGRIWILADFQTAPPDLRRRFRPDGVFTGQDRQTEVYLIDREIRGTAGLPSRGAEGKPRG